MLTLKKYFKWILHKEHRPVISRDCMSAIAKARSISGPYHNGMSLRTYARDFLCKYQDGDYRVRVRMPDMTVADLNVLAQVARW